MIITWHRAANKTRTILHEGGALHEGTLSALNGRSAQISCLQERAVMVQRELSLFAPPTFPGGCGGEGGISDLTGTRVTGAKLMTSSPGLSRRSRSGWRSAPLSGWPGQARP